MDHKDTEDTKNGTVASALSPLDNGAKVDTAVGAPSSSVATQLGESTKVSSTDVCVPRSPSAIVASIPPSSKGILPTPLVKRKDVETAKVPKSGLILAPRPKQNRVNVPSPEVNVVSKDWASLFSTSATKQHQTGMEFFPPEKDCSQKFVVLEEEEVKEVDEAWGFILVGYVWGKSPVYTPFLQFIKKLCKSKAEIKLSLQGNGFFMARVPLTFSTSTLSKDSPEGAPEEILFEEVRRTKGNKDGNSTPQEVGTLVSQPDQVTKAQVFSQSGEAAMLSLQTNQAGKYQSGQAALSQSEQAAHLQAEASQSEHQAEKSQSGQVARSQSEQAVIPHVISFPAGQPSSESDVEIQAHFSQKSTTPVVKANANQGSQPLQMQTPLAGNNPNDPILQVVLHPEFINKAPAGKQKRVKKSAAKGEHLEGKHSLPSNPETKKNKKKKHGPLSGPSKAEA
ncbi:hypothetical protein QJS04_geneDACA023007 [Acorus gramineus]|uniref:Uncharacterized protein n=1 Tax=Acorus gramineus TaxID=55184 RepID=A0AAV9BT63_ACOGR|nr:hypothetical protein QJS04_geneDACA023007 [Acorus gramineus]